MIEKRRCMQSVGYAQPHAVDVELKAMASPTKNVYGCIRDDPVADPGILSTAIPARISEHSSMSCSLNPK
jgi:hypothetical protein